MNIRHLRIFKAVCEEGSITKAAESIFVSQPAVSNAISELEDYLGTCLFDRIPRGIELNEIGKVFLEKTRRLLDLYDDMEESTRELEGKATIKIGSSITIANFILPKIITEFEKTHKSTPIIVTVDNARKIEDMVVQNKLDIGLVEGVIYNHSLTNIPFGSYKLAAICSPNHKFAKMKSININQLIGERLLLREKGSAIRDIFDSALLLEGRNVTPNWTSVNSNALIQGVKENLGISILPEEKIEDEVVRGSIAKLSIEDMDLISTNHVVIHKNKYKTEAMKRFIEIIGSENSQNKNTVYL